MILAPSLVKSPAALPYLGRLCGVIVTLFGACDLYVVPVAKRGMYARASTELLRAAHVAAPIVDSHGV
jgi:hypothetical protein